jgi:hypothetical protein
MSSSNRRASTRSLPSTTASSPIRPCI